MSGSRSRRWAGFGRWLRRLGREVQRCLPSRRWRLEAFVEQADDVPDLIPPRRAFLVGSRTRRKWLVFDCPCASGHRIILNLDRSRRPFWTVRASRWRGITVCPSVAYRGRDRSCHYVVSNGRIGWIRAS